LGNLGALGARAAVPVYERADLSAGIIHFGVGNFHRAHQAVYLDALFNSGRDRDWAILGTGVRPTDEGMRQKLKAQDFLTTVVEQSADRSSARVTGSMVGFLPPGHRADIVERLADPAIRIVSLTVTEGGYYIDPATGAFDPETEDIRQDASNPQSPATAFGLIVAGLKRRRAAGVGPFTVMSCDNIPHNGVVTRNAVAGLAGLSDAGLAAWIEDEVAFPNGMVDRIALVTTDRERKLLADDFGIEDAWPVYCESFSQWVLEDTFPAGRPQLETVGVTFVPDVTPYENMKIRILNGGHAAIGYPAALMDIHFVHEAMEEPLIRSFLAKLAREEIIPVLPPVPDTNLDDYFRLIDERLANPKIGDTVPRLCQDGSNRQPKFILPSTADRLRQGRSITGLSLVSALWCRYLAGTTDSGKPIAIDDAAAERLTAAAHAAKDDPKAFLALHDIFGELAQSEAFESAFADALGSLWHRGTRETLERYLGKA
jgi:mannitol 2-dehydrogenase